MKIFDYSAGTSPLLISIPHAGTYVPPEMAADFTATAKATPDTDWHVERLYDFAGALGAHIIIATHSRYVVDLNRDPAGNKLYPGQFNSGLCPTETFARQPIYSGATPDEAKIESRIKKYWQPYHDKITATLAAIKSSHGHAILFDAHSIESKVPALFEGILPTLNLGTADGTSCQQKLAETALSHCQKSGYSHVLNGRFKGGYITRHYGRPDDKIDAIQLEIAQSSYMDEGAPYRYDEVKAAKLKDFLYAMLKDMAGI